MLRNPRAICLRAAAGLCAEGLLKKGNDMKRSTHLAFVVFCILFTVELADAQLVFFKEDHAKYFIEIVIDSEPQASMSAVTVEQYIMEKKRDPKTGRESEKEEPRLIHSASVVPVADGDKIRLTLEVGKPELNRTYKVSALAAGVPVGGVDKVTVTAQLEASFFTSPGYQCDGGIALMLAGLSDDRQSREKPFWDSLFKYMFSPTTKVYEEQTVNGQKVTFSQYVNDRPNDVMELSFTSNGSPLRKMMLRSIVSRSVPGQAPNMVVCLDSQHKPPKEFNIRVQFIKDTTDHPRPIALRDPFIGDGLSAEQGPSAEKMSSKPGAVGERGLEENLDLGISFTSSRETLKDEATMMDKTQRINRGVLDVRLAPILNARRSEVPPFTTKGFWFLTPIYLDANVATGRIIKETVSLNRIEFGSEVEYRYIPFRRRTVEQVINGQRVTSEETDTSHFTTFYRWMIKGKHSSDRDFKQREVGAAFEFQPVIAGLNHPLGANWVDNRKDAITGKNVYVYSSFGWEFKPTLGFDFGRTYHHRDTAAAVQPSPNVRRLYTQMEIALDLTSHIKLSATDIFFYRWEVSENRKKNYFICEIDLPIGQPFREAIHALFISYENGNKPPFDSPDVSSFRIGYRIRANGWFGRRR
jgi:hypothetical protein